MKSVNLLKLCNKKGVKICGFIGSILITCYLAYFAYFAFTVYNEIQAQSPIIYEGKRSRNFFYSSFSEKRQMANKLAKPEALAKNLWSYNKKSPSFLLFEWAVCFQNIGTRILTEIPSQIPTLRQPIFIAKNLISSWNTSFTSPQARFDILSDF